MAAPFDAGNLSIYGDYLQLSGSGTSAPTGSSRGLSFLFASSSSGLERDTKLYFLNGTGSAQLLGSTDFNFTVAGDSGTSQSITDGNTLTLAGGSGLASVASNTDTVTFNVDIAGTTDIGAGLADADEILVDDGGGGTIRRSDMSRVKTYIGTGLTMSADLDLGDNNLTNGGDIDCDSVSVADATVGLNIDFSGATVTGRQKISLPDNLAEALVVEESGNDYLTFVTTNGSEQVTISQNASFADKNITNVGDINCDSISVDAAGTGLNIDFSGGNTGTGEITLADNLADALSIVEGSNDYMKFTTTNSQEGIGFGVMAAPLTDNSTMLGAGSYRWAQGHIVVAHLDQLGQALDANSQAITNINVDSGNIDNTVIGATTAVAGSFTTLVGSTGTFSGRLVCDDTTEATTTTDGSLQTDGGLSVAKSVVVGDDLDLLSDSCILNIGSTSKFTLTDQAANNTVMATSGHRLAFGNAGEYISGDGTDLLIVSSADVKVTGDLIPSADDTYDLGTTSAAWQDLHLEGDVLFTDAGKVSTAAGNLTLDSAASNADIVFTGNDGGSGITALTLDMSEAGAATFNAGVACTTLAVAGGTISGDVILALPNNKDAKARAWMTYSERSLKTNIKPMQDALATVNKMQGYSYDLKNGGKQEVGFMADEVANVVPEVVTFHKDGTAAGLDYGRLTSVLVEAIKAQQIQIDELKKQIK